MFWPNTQHQLLSRTPPRAHMLHSCAWTQRKAGAIRLAQFKHVFFLYWLNQVDGHVARSHTRLFRGPMAWGLADQQCRQKPRSGGRTARPAAACQASKILVMTALACVQQPSIQYAPTHQGADSCATRVCQHPSHTPAILTCTRQLPAVWVWGHTLFWWDILPAAACSECVHVTWTSR
jgi:hypothetical protein